MREERRPEDVNVEVAGLLLDMAALQRARPSAYGYKRAAYAIFSLDRPLSVDLKRNAFREIRGVGPAVERIAREHAEDGRSATVEGALAAAAPSTRADVLRRRAVRANFLSWASVLHALRSPAPEAVVTPADYRGDLQVHSTWSDGADDLETLADGALARGWSRLCVTDHSYGLPIARGMSMEAAARQHRAIDALNDRFDGRFRMLKGIEANILADGRLDMTEEELGLFDLVVAAPHSVLRKPYDQTDRLIQALRTPGVHILGHPRGRVFSKRAGILADWERVFAEAARRAVAIEIDGTWDRQDVDHDLARLALDSGCLLAADSDAHAVRELDYTSYALAHARLARVPADRLINCWDDRRLLEWARTLRASAPAARATAARAPAARRSRATRG